jgi:hypothetical protein
MSFGDRESLDGMKPIEFQRPRIATNAGVAQNSSGEWVASVTVISGGPPEAPTEAMKA